jgi:aminoglycoside phosphotransferase (APT) family kinase protein
VGSASVRIQDAYRNSDGGYGWGPGAQPDINDKPAGRGRGSAASTHVLVTRPAVNLTAVNMDLASLVAAVQAERADIVLSGAVLHAGRQNVVLETQDGWILRFPRQHTDFEREVATLRCLAGRLPASIPHVEWTGHRARFAAYRKVSGHTFELVAYQGASHAQRDELAASLADFLAAMHQSLTPEEIHGLHVPEHEPAGTDPTPMLATLPPDARRFVHQLISEADHLRAERRSASKPNVVLHNDFHFWNIVLSAPVGKVTGVWDFSSVAMGDPSDDLRYIPNDSCDLMHRLARHYQRRTGTKIDMRAATLANRIEVVFDAIEHDQTSNLVDTIRRWQRTAIPHSPGPMAG